MNSEWLFQFIASVAWVMSVFVYGSYGLGDCLQLLAASAWTISNLISLANKRKNSSNKVNKTIAQNKSCEA
jgi:hypothetical protein